MVARSTLCFFGMLLLITAVMNLLMLFVGFAEEEAAEIFSSSSNLLFIENANRTNNVDVAAEEEDIPFGAEIPASTNLLFIENANRTNKKVLSFQVVRSYFPGITTGKTEWTRFTKDRIAPYRTIPPHHPYFEGRISQDLLRLWTKQGEEVTASNFLSVLQGQQSTFWYTFDQEPYRYF